MKNSSRRARRAVTSDGTAPSNVLASARSPAAIATSNLARSALSAFGQRDLYWSLGIGFVVGLAAHVGGFLLKTGWSTRE